MNPLGMGSCHEALKAYAVSDAILEGTMENEDLTGKWAVCGKGRLGRIEGQKMLDWGLSWVGTGLDGQPWASRKPVLLSAHDATLLESAIHGGHLLSR